jgi:hypothetical protein
MTKEVGIAIAAVTCCLIGVGGMGWHTETHQSVSQSDLSSDTPPDRPASDTSAQA